MIENSVTDAEARYVTTWREKLKVLLRIVLRAFGVSQMFGLFASSEFIFVAE